MTKINELLSKRGAFNNMKDHCEYENFVELECRSMSMDNRFDWFYTGHTLPTAHPYWEYRVNFCNALSDLVSAQDLRRRIESTDDELTLWGLYGQKIGKSVMLMLINEEINEKIQCIHKIAKRK